MISRNSRSFKATIDELDSADREQVITWGDTIIADPEMRAVCYRVYGDSIEFKIDNTDTLFDLQENDVLRKFKGYLFANSRYTDDSWTTKKITPTRQGLIVSAISYDGEIEELKELTVIRDDSLVHSYNPSRRQMKLFVRNKGFKQEEHYIRID